MAPGSGQRQGAPRVASTDDRWLSIFLAGCTVQTYQSVVRTKAVNDLPCDEKQIQVSNTQTGSLEAKGCGKSATYQCQMGGENNAEIQCEKEPPQSTAQ
jgi:hypothetical protein